MWATWAAMADHVDEQLWLQCLQAIPSRSPRPEQLPLRVPDVDGRKVYLVDGDLVKTNHDMDFVEGGNFCRYRYIPKGEIWLDDNIQVHDLPYILYHEAFETRLMLDGTSYDPAHVRANKVERELRLRGRRNA